ncbi:hypothetical protein [Humisphaera borealis]|uniref:Uncharacterized protein n=1 Tax=Humisphaera borealis TaxID=2807512 RepID=A0A7M2WYT4_9BACT|nr:hypothetical protein [Humisphaera borealis]QOV90589.1 hypothetical protein IPV69_04280 [Humisphaera borealis]
MPISRLLAAFGVVVSFVSTLAATAADPVFSGPQAGEKVSPFKIVDFVGGNAGKEREVVAAADETPVTIIFVHGIERSILPLLTTLDEYGHRRRETLRMVIVLLSGDRADAEKRLPAVNGSIKLHTPMALSVDGAEGPGNYGLNKACLMTVLVASKNIATANFALIQPGIADAPTVIKAMAAASGDGNPPTPEALQAERAKRTGAIGGMRRGATQPAVSQPASGPTTKPAAVHLPGAAPTDEKLMGLLRSFIQRANDDARVDQVVKEVEAYVKDDSALKKQAIDGWVRVLHLKYGTDYAQKAGKDLVDRLQKPKE